MRYQFSPMASAVFSISIPPEQACFRATKKTAENVPQLFEI
jgi:hypothetical protein